MVPRGADSYDLNFQNADINAVTKVLLGDILKLTYSVDPRVQGTLSLSSGRPVPEISILTLYESAVKNRQRQRGTRRRHLQGRCRSARRSATARLMQATVTPGYGISVMPLRYVSAKTVLQAIDSFATKPGMVRVDKTRNLLLVQGAEHRAGERDRDSAGARRRLDEEPVGRRFPGRAMPARRRSSRNCAKCSIPARRAPRSRSRALPADQPAQCRARDARADHLIKQVKTWVARLDRADYDNTTVRVYRLRYGNAKLIAAILRDVFTGQGGWLAASAIADLSQLTPGSSIQRGSSTGTSDTGTGSGTGTSTAPVDVRQSAATLRPNRRGSRPEPAGSQRRSHRHRRPFDQQRPRRPGATAPTCGSPPTSPTIRC